VAAEALLGVGKFAFQTEFQGHSYWGVRNTSGYALLRYSMGILEPCSRIEWVTPIGRKPDAMLIGGVNLFVIDRHVGVSANCFYRRNYQDNWDVSGFMVHLQARM
jgi:hypothetical protein